MEEKTANTSVGQTSYSEDAGKIDLFKIMHDLWKGVKNGWWLPLVLALAAGALRFATIDRNYAPYYETSAAVYVKMANSDKGSSYKDALSAEQMVIVFPYLLQNGVLTDAIETQLGTEGIPGSIDVQADPYTSLLTFTVTGSDPEAIHELLEAVITVFPDTLSYIVGPTQFTVFKDMGVPSEPANQKPSQLSYVKEAVKSAVKVFFGVLLLILLYSMTIRTISNTQEIKNYLNAPNLGALPSIKKKKRTNQQKNQLTLDNSQIPFGFKESVRTIRTRFERIAEEKEIRVLLVTSTVPGEGKTTVAANLALSLAQKGRKVLLIDGDMRNPSVSSLLQLKGTDRGLYEFLSGEASADQVIRVLPDSGLYVITAGRVSRKSADLLSSETMKELLDQVRAYADYVIVDTPPVMVLGDSMALGKYVDGCIYVVRRDYVRRHLVLEGFSQIAENGCRIAGTILNDDLTGSTGVSSHYGHYGKYGSYGKYAKTYGYSYGEKDTGRKA